MLDLFSQSSGSLLDLSLCGLTWHTAAIWMTSQGGRFGLLQTAEFFSGPNRSNYNFSHLNIIKQIVLGPPIYMGVIILREILGAMIMNPGLD